MAGGYPAGIDWSAPWYAPWRAAGESVARAVAGGLPLPEALDRALDRALDVTLDRARDEADTTDPMRFVAHDALPPGKAYEQYIAETGRCPTREGPHDFFNGLAWLRFPRTKRCLNRLQAAQIAARGVGATRGPVRDALTVFDENAAFLHAPPLLWEALLAQQWHRLFVELRAQWASARLVVFGHAALEKLLQPHKAITVHVYRTELPALANFCAAADSIAAWDRAVSQSLQAEVLASKPFTPLPVLGVPGWWGGNADFSFYDDASVFRPRRTT